MLAWGQAGPQINEVLPNYGRTGETVVIIGSKLGGAVSVSFAGVAAGFKIVSDEEVQGVVPAGAVSGPVKVVTPAGTAASLVDFVVLPEPLPPGVDSFAPTSGAPGDFVALFGSNFVDVASVKLGALAAAFKVISESNLVFTVPEGAVSAPVTVDTAAGTALSAAKFALVPPPPPPVVKTFDPATGPPGQLIVIHGQNLALAAAVLFNATEGAFEIVSDTELEAVVPEGAGNGPITVIGANGIGVSAALFEFQAPPALPRILSFKPARGKAGQEVIIVGTDFNEVTNVLFGGLSASFSTVSNVETRAVVPKGATNAAIHVMTKSGNASSTDEFIVDAAKFPAITKVTPGAARAGEPLVITGPDLDNTWAVLVNGREAAFQIMSNGTIEIELPRGVTPGPLAVLSAEGVAFGPVLQPLLPDPSAPRLGAFWPAVAMVGDTVHIFGANLGGAQSVSLGGRSAQFTVVSDGEIAAVVPPGGASGVVAVNAAKDWASALADFVARKPGTAAPPPPLDLTAGTNGQAVLSFAALSNQSYRVDLATTLDPDAWQTWRGPPTPPSNNILAAAISGAATAQFFRLMALPVGWDNWDFEQGLLMWTWTGNAFDNQPTYGATLPAERVRPLSIGGNYWHTDFPIGAHQDYWIGTAESHPNPGDPVRRGPDPAAEALTGTLTSREFRISSTFLTFLISGGNDINRLRVELQIRPADAADRARLPALGFDGDWGIVLFATGLNSEVMSREVWDVRRFRSRVARVRIVDQSTTGHINVDDFRFPEEDPRYGEGEPAPPSAASGSGLGSFALPAPVDFVPPPPALLRVSEGGQTRFRDPREPVWGFADTHAHPMSYLGLGGKFISGHPDGPINTALRSCEQEHGIGGTGVCPFGDCVGNPLFAAVEGEGLGHRTGGWEYDFDGWPSFHSHTHQAMYVEWVRRAWQGGLRLMVAHAVNNEFLGSISGGGRPGHPAFDDVSSVEAQLGEMQALVARHPDFMEIALTPRAARRIIHEGKLAVVLGVEVDSPGNFRSGNNLSVPDFSALVAHVRAYLEHLYSDLGVRHFFPVHLADNAFGGCALYNDLWVANNLYLQRRPFLVTTAPPEIQFRLFFGGLDPRFVSLLESFGLPHLTDDTPPVGGHINAQSLTPAGRELFFRLHTLGMVIDVDHMGLLTRSNFMNWASGDPLISGHSGFVEMSWRLGETSQPGKLPHEGDLLPDTISRIARNCGMISPNLIMKDVRPWGTQVANDCAGSSKSWAQLYLYALDQMGRQGVGLATDYLLTTAYGPRFGPNAAYALVESPDALRNPLRRAQVDAQANGVRYRSPLLDYRPTRFNNLDGRNIYDDVEMDFWWAAASYRGGARPEETFARLGIFDFLDRRGRVFNFARGLAAFSDAELLRPGIFTGDAPWEQRAAFLVRNGLAPGSSERDPARVHELYPEVLRVWQKWQAMDGDNPPLERCVVTGRNGPRDYDINLDGLAHYGLLPDFLQDCRNAGLTADDLTVMFNSAEAYIRLWERCRRE